MRAESKAKGVANARQWYAEGHGSAYIPGIRLEVRPHGSLAPVYR